ncbi:Pycsar system effector family protein [Kitasatospora sp. NPDC058965]|uniref:Pycsar system effector family protein n=1 Tax=Kitasatospora sp. NPDC058965 TaxID=3346682 RepID=UPI003685060D
MSAPNIGTNAPSFPGASGVNTIATGAAGGLDAAWRIHGSLCDWVGRVDVKASLALSLETAALVAITTLTQTMQSSGTCSERRQTATVVDLWFSAVLIAAGLVFAIAAVAPRIASRGDSDDWRHNAIYFGHLRHWNADELANELADQDLLPALSRQLVTLSRIAWAKHVRVRVSLVLGGIGVTLAAVPAMMNAMV